jgi:uncharacterized protein DUF389
MHEIRVTGPLGNSESIAQLALSVGAKHVSVYSVYTYGPNQQQEVLSAELPTPQAKAFLDALLSSPRFDAARCTVTSRELRAILSQTHPRELTQPLPEPAVDVFEDLWQLSHLTWSYIGRAVSAGFLLAFGMVTNSSISIVIAALFFPFLPPILGMSFGLWTGERALAWQGFKALAASTCAAFLTGFVVAFFTRSPLTYSEWKSPLISLCIAVVIGVAAGLSSADDAGRRYLIGVAAAVHLSVVPAWFGITAVLGFPSAGLMFERGATFLLNVGALGASAALAYGLLGMKKEKIQLFQRALYGPDK